MQLFSGLTGNNQTGINVTNGNEEDGQVMNNLMSDIQNGFVHRRLPDGGFKVQFFMYSLFRKDIF